MNVERAELLRSNLPDNKTKFVQKKEEMALEFEKIFVRKIVQEMTKGLFKTTDNNSMMASGNHLYRSQMIKTLSEELAKQETLGMSETVLKHWNVETESTDKNR